MIYNMFFSTLLWELSMSHGHVSLIRNSRIAPLVLRLSYRRGSLINTSPPCKLRLCHSYVSLIRNSRIAPLVLRLSYRRGSLINTSPPCKLRLCHSYVSLKKIVTVLLQT
ncbi:hypothetical protein ACB098_12G100900 [Castanea mollissima]